MKADVFHPSHPFFAALPERYCGLLASAMEPRHFEPGAMLAKEGEPSRSLLLILSGRVGVGSRKEGEEVEIFQVLEAGDVIGWSWLIPPHQWQFDCQAIDNVAALAIDGEWLRWQCEQNFELSHYVQKQLLTILTKRVAALRASGNAEVSA